MALFAGCRAASQAVKAPRAPLSDPALLVANPPTPAMHPLSPPSSVKRSAGNLTGASVGASSPAENSGERAPLLLAPTATPPALAAIGLAANDNGVSVASQVALPTLTPVPTDTPRPALLAAAPAIQSAARRILRTPILMYHYLSTPPANADIYRRDLSVSPELFAAHLDRIQAEGYTTVSLVDLYLALTQGAPLPDKPVVITFDDGYGDNYANAFPALQQRRMTATFFVVIDFINAQRPEYMTWDMLREMHAAGMSIEAHGIDHTSLKRRTHEDLVFQAMRCYETLQNEIGVRAHFISYPAGQYDQATVDVFRSAGYWAGVTTQQGATHSSDKLLELSRVRIRNTTSADELARLLTLDW
jgi:peptidoglycan/xylan/chitin deacetylase (PgdA/CDA1 family)